MSIDVCQAVASPTALRGSDPVSEPGIKAFKGHLIKWLVAQRGKIESGEVCAAADDIGGTSMLLDLVVGRRVGRVEPVSPVICAPVICATCSTGLDRAGPGKCGAHNYGARGVA